MIKDCYEVFCDTYNMSCFMDCNNMFSNACYLLHIQKRLNATQDMLDATDENRLNNLKADFQKKFNLLCSNLLGEYDKIISEKEAKNGDK